MAGFMLGGGYTIAALAPFGLGAVRDATGSFTASLWVVVATTVGALVAFTFLGRERLRRGV